MRPISLAHLGPANPRRPLDWRWQRAGRLLELGLRWSLRRDDAQVRRAKQYQAALRRCRCVADRGRLERKMPDVAGAAAIVEGEPTTRGALEAWLLAGEPIEAIARRCGVPVEAVEVYEALFFNVADRLTCTSYVLFCAIGPATYKGFDGDDTGAVLKWFAYVGGVRVLDFLLGAGDTPCDLLPSEGRAIPPDEAARSARLRRMALTAKALPINLSTATRLIGLCALREGLRETPSRSASDALAASLDAMLGDLTRSHVDEVQGSVGTDEGDRDEAHAVTSDSGTVDDAAVDEVLRFAEVVGADLAAGALARRVTGARRRA